MPEASPAPERSNVLVLSGSAEHANADRAVLVRLGFHGIRVFDSLEAAWPWLTTRRVSLIVLDSSLDGQDPMDCLRRLRTDRRFLLTPVLMVTLENRRQAVLDAIAGGCNGYVLRPYTEGTLERHLKVAMDSVRMDAIDSEMLQEARALLAEGDAAAAREGFEELVGDDNDAQAHFDRGMEHLVRGEYGQAILAFNRAVAINELFAEAYKGLADAYRASGDMDQYKKYLEHAATIYAVQDRLQETKALFVELLKAEPEAVNPYNNLGVELRKNGDYAGALHAYSRALELTPEDEHVHFNVAKAHVFAGSKDTARHHLGRALELNPGFGQARDLLIKLGGAPPEPDQDWDEAAPPPDTTARLDSD